MGRPKVVPLQLTLLDGTIVRVGDKVLARITHKGYRVCHVLEILKGCGVDKAILNTSHAGQVICTRYQMRRYEE